MKNLRRAIVLTTGMALLLFTVGFVMFATVVTRPPAVEDPRADGIVVLTGESRRIAEGARLLKEGRAERMLMKLVVDGETDVRVTPTLPAVVTVNVKTIAPPGASEPLNVSAPTCSNTTSTPSLTPAAPFCILRAKL